jgi:tetratricopeptide (TPR) repeat protein
MINTGFEPGQRNLTIHKGYLLLGQKLYDQAYKVFSDLLSHNPQDYEALVGLASVFQHKNKTDDSIKIALRAIEINPEYYHAYDILAEIYFINKNDYIKAEEFALKSLELEPFASSTYSLLAQIYFFQRQYDSCYYYANQALMLDPENYIAHMALGLYYYQIPDFEKAKEHYKACLAIAPNCSVVYGNYGNLNLTFAENKMGYELIREALRLNPSDRFLQESFREAFIRNNPFYAPLYWATNSRFDDVYLIYILLVSMITAAFLSQIPLIPDFIKALLIYTFLFTTFFMLFLVFYRFIIRFLVNIYYSWCIKTNRLAKII